MWSRIFTKDLDEDKRLRDLQAAYARGNHKSAAQDEQFLAEVLKKEIKKGWILLLPDKNIWKYLI